MLVQRPEARQGLGGSQGGAHDEIGPLLPGVLDDRELQPLFVGPVHEQP